MKRDELEWIKNLPMEERKNALLQWLKDLESEGTPMHYMQESELEVEVEHE